MDISEIIKRAQTEALVEGVNEGLKIERRVLTDLDKLIGKASNLELVLGKQNDDFIVILPVSFANRSNLEDYLVNGICSALSKYEPKELKYSVNGVYFLAYKLTKKFRGRLPSKLKISANNIKFNLDIIKVDAYFNTFDVYSDKTVSKEHYVPDVKNGDEFYINLKRESCFRYNLIPFNKDTRGKFPGYKIPFEIHYDDHIIKTHVTAAGNNTSVGALAGTYASVGIKKLYEDHPEVRKSKRIKIKVVKPGEVYKIISFK